MNKQKPLQRRKLWVLLKSLNDQERKKLSTYINCELEDTHPEAVLLFRNIPGNLTRELLWASTFPNEPYKDTKFRKLCFILTNQVEQFIAIQGFLQDESLKELVLVRELNRREGDSKLFLPAFKKVWNKVEEAPLRGAPYHRRQYELLAEQSRYQIKHIPKHKRHHVASMHHSFDLYWLHEKLILTISSLNHKMIGHEDVSSFLQDELLDRIEDEVKFMNYPSLDILKNLYRLITGKKESGDNLIKMVREYQGHFDKGTYLNIYICLLNHYIRKSNITREDRYRIKSLEMYVWGIEEQLVFIDGRLPLVYFRNILILACRLEKFNWAKTFVNEYLEYIPFEDQEECFTYSEALIHFSQKEYRETCKKLINRFKNIKFEAEVKSYLYISQYELDRIDDLEKDIRTYKIFLKNNKKVGKKSKQSLLNFATYFEKLIKFDKPHKLQELLENIVEIKPMSNQEWLVKKIEIKLNRFPKEVMLK